MEIFNNDHINSIKGEQSQKTLCDEGGIEFLAIDGSSFFTKEKTSTVNT